MSKNKLLKKQQREQRELRQARRVTGGIILALLLVMALGLLAYYLVS